MSKETDFLDFIENQKKFEQEALQKATMYSLDSGITAIVDRLNTNKAEAERVKEVQNLQEGTVAWRFNISEGHYINVQVDSKGTIKIHGAPLTGSTTIIKDKWTKHPELIDKGLIKAFNHPDVIRYE